MELIHFQTRQARKKVLLALAVVLGVSIGFFLARQNFSATAPFKAKVFGSAAYARFSLEKEGLTSSRRMLAAQVSVFQCRNYEQVEKRVTELKAAGINTIIVRAFQNPGDGFHRFARPQNRVGVYFETAHAPMVDPILARVVSIGHRHGMKVFAWMETRKTPLALPDPKSHVAIAYRIGSRSFEPIQKWSIFDEVVEKKLLGLYRDIARSGIDGILIQDDLIMYQNEDFNPWAVALFQGETERVLDPQTLYEKVFRDSNGRWLVSRYSETFWAWSRWKNEKLLNFANELIQAAKAVNPEIKIAMNFMYESVTDPENALAWLSQHLPEATRLPIDFFAIMAYHRQMKKELRLTDAATYEKISSMTQTLLSLIDDPNKILMKVQTADWDTSKGIPPFEIDEIFQRINSRGTVSLAFTPCSAKAPLNVIARHFH
ncbi:MAG: hypothetical protein HWN68_02120 [Desulfobacterales bacterium]|nr:hypothetical protein [Desulfobacterales bacterium]